MFSEKDVHVFGLESSGWKREHPAAFPRVGKKFQEDEKKRKEGEDYKNQQI